MRMELIDSAARSPHRQAIGSVISVFAPYERWVRNDRRCYDANLVGSSEAGWPDRPGILTLYRRDRLVSLLDEEYQYYEMTDPVYPRHTLASAFAIGKRSGSPQLMK